MKKADSNRPAWQVTGDEIVQHLSRRPLLFRLIILTLGAVTTVWVIWSRALDNTQRIDRFTLTITALWLLPYIFYAAVVRTRTGTVGGGILLLTIHIILFQSITANKSSTAALGFLTAHLLLEGVILVVVVVDLVSRARKK